jgi:hypothetical protein
LNQEYCPTPKISAALEKVKAASPLQKAALALARLSIGLSITEAEGTLTSDELEKQTQKLFRGSKRLLDILDMLSEE